MKNKVTAQDFFDTCEKYAKSLNAIDTDLLINKKAWGVSLSFKICRAEIVFYRKSAFPAPKNSVCCRVFVNKNSPVFFMLSDIQEGLSENDFRAVYFSKVNSQTLDICIESITQVLSDYVKKIEESLLTSFDDTLYENLFDEYRREYKLKPEDLDFSLIGDEEKGDHYYFLNLQHHRERYLLFKFTQTEPYIYLPSGSPELVLSVFKKKKEPPTRYEQKLIEFLKTPAAENFSIYPEKYKTLITKTQKPSYIVSSEIDKKLPLYWLIMFVPFAAVFCLIMALAQEIMAGDAIAAYFAPWYLGAIPAGLCGIFGGIVFRRPLVRLLEGKKADTKIEQDKMINGSKIDTVSKIAFGVSVLFAIFLVTVFSLGGARVFEEKLDYWDGPGYPKQEYYYENVEKVYHIDAREGGFGDRIERGSYIIYMEDGRFFDLDCTASEAQTEKTLLPLIKEKNAEVEFVYLDSDKDLPFKLFEEE